MKEILKYLRQLHSFTQEEVAQQIGLSRQSYIKYEKGMLQPNARVVARLAELYQVPDDFIYRNEVPQLNPGISSHGFGNQSGNTIYHIEPDYGQCMVADSGDETVSVVSSYHSGQSGRKEPKTYEGYFDGTAVHVLTDEVIPIGKRFKLVEISSNGEEEAERKRRAWETILNCRGSVSVPADFDYKEELYIALREKYGLAD